jgi:uncharacterized Fe-S cluster-containing MiaB family protein
MLNDIKQIQTLYTKTVNIFKQEINSSQNRKFNFVDFLNEYNKISMYNLTIKAYFV